MWTGQRGTEWPEGQEGREGARPYLWSAPRGDGVTCDAERVPGPEGGVLGRGHGAGPRGQLGGARPAADPAQRHGVGGAGPLPPPWASARLPRVPGVRGPRTGTPTRPQTTAISGEKRPLFLSRDALSWGQRGGAAPAPLDRLGSEAQMRPAAWKGRGLGCDFDTSGETVQITVFGGGAVALWRPGRSHVLLSQGS